MDQQTRRRHARQELAVVFGVLLAACIALAIASLAAHQWLSAATAGLVCVSMGINVRTQLRRLSPGKDDAGA